VGGKRNSIEGEVVGAGHKTGGGGGGPPPSPPPPPHKVDN